MYLIAPIVNLSFLLLYFIFTDATAIKTTPPSIWVVLIFCSSLVVRRYADGLQDTTLNIARILLLQSGKSDKNRQAIYTIQLFLTPDSSIKIGYLWIILCIASFVSLTFATGWLIAILALTLAVFGFPWFLPLLYQYHLKNILKQLSKNKQTDIYNYLLLNAEFPDLEDTIKDAIKNKRNPREWWGDIKFGKEPEAEERFDDGVSPKPHSPAPSSPRSNEVNSAETESKTSDSDDDASEQGAFEHGSNQRETPLEEDREKHDAIGAYLELKDIFNLLSDDSINDREKHQSRRNWPADMTEAIQPILTLANDGDIDACLLASNHYAIKRFGLLPDRKSERSWMLAAAERGDTPAMLRVSGMFFDLYTPEDTKSGKKWLIRAAESGDAKALLILARYYTEGIHFQKDARKAIQCHFKRYKLGEPHCATRIGSLYMEQIKDYKKGLRWLHHAAKQRDTRSYTDLYRAYNDRTLDHYNPEEAFYWLKLHTDACPSWTSYSILLAKHYRDGNGTPQDRNAAVAQLNCVLGLLISKETSTDYIQAKELLNDIETSLF